MMREQYDVWAMMPEALGELAEVWRTWRAGGVPQTARPAPREPQRQGVVAVLPIVGPITQRGGGLFELLFGGTSTGAIRAQLDQAVNDPSVLGIVLDIDSPGGTVGGVPELAEAVYNARAVKPIVAVSNTLMASAAYWLGSQADKLLASPSSQTGSIGVYALHLDMSRAYDADGVTPTLVSAGKYKTEGSPFGPLDDTGRAAWQAQVDEYYSLFVNDVARGRGKAPATVRNGFGEGRVLTASAAVAEHLADEVGSLDAAIAAVTRLAKRRANARAEALRMATL